MQLYHTLDGEAAVNAFQVNGQGIGEGHELLVRCTRENGKLVPVPKGLEVFGATIAAVQVNSSYVQVDAGDYVVILGGAPRAVLDSFTFDQLYKKVD